MQDFKEEKAQMGVVMGLIAVAVGILILAVVLTIGPVVGYNVENSVTIPITSAWNSGNGGSVSMLNGSELWAQDTPLLGSAAIVVIAAIIIGVLLGSFMLRRTS